MQPWTSEMPPMIGVVVPCYHEEEVLPETAKRLSVLLEQLVEDKLIAMNSYVLFVDDGSKDRTWAIIESLHETNSRLRGLKLARNTGHQNALLAGLMTAKEDADAVISIDADLQDDIEAIREFVVQFRAGYEVVYGVRDDRSTDTRFKRGTAQIFYKLMSRLGVDIVYNHADYRLMSKRAVEYLAEYTEVNLFLRGIVPLIGLSSTQVRYKRYERFAGESKYPLRKMLGFAIDGITSFSVRPIRMVTATGFIFLALSIIVALYALIAKISGQAFPGWTSIVLSIWFVGGVQIMCIGLVGEYIGKIYKEVKRRPKFHIEQLLRSGWMSEDRQEEAGQSESASQEQGATELRVASEPAVERVGSVGTRSR